MFGESIIFYFFTAEKLYNREYEVFVPEILLKNGFISSTIVVRAGLTHTSPIVSARFSYSLSEIFFLLSEGSLHLLLSVEDLLFRLGYFDGGL